MPTPIAVAPKATIQEKIDAYLDDLRRAKRPAGTISDKQLHFRLFERAPEHRAHAHFVPEAHLTIKRYQRHSEGIRRLTEPDFLEAVFWQAAEDFT
jgi:hypothetical protein